MRLELFEGGTKGGNNLCRVLAAFLVCSQKILTSFQEESDISVAMTIIPRHVAHEIRPE